MGKQPLDKRLLNALQMFINTDADEETLVKYLKLYATNYGDCVEAFRVLCRIALQQRGKAEKAKSMSGLKLWESSITVRVMEYEFSTPKLLMARGMKDACNKMESYCQDYYGNGKDMGDGSFSFNGGCPIVSYTLPHEVKEIVDWHKEMMVKSLIKG